MGGQFPLVAVASSRMKKVKQVVWLFCKVRVPLRVVWGWAGWRLPLRLLASVGVVLAMPEGVALANGSDVETVRARLETEWLERVEWEAARDWRDELGEDGRWPDLDYTDRQTTRWPHREHMERATRMALAYRAPGSPLTGDVTLRKAVARAWAHWFEHDYRNDNWWFNEIGIPAALALGMVVLKDELSEYEREEGLRILRRARIQAESQNLVWLAEINALRGLVEGDEDLVARAYGRIRAEIRVVASEGLQADHSLLQHRGCLYNHGYGASFAVDGTRLARLLHGTRFAFEPERLGWLTAYVLDGGQWMAMGRHADWAARGREIARRGDGGAGRSYLTRAAENLSGLGTGREGELQALIARTTEEAGTEPLTGNRHFWRGHLTVHQRPGFYASARTYSTRLANTDFNGPENLLAHHVADGATTLMRHGGEYAGIFPLWDWQRLPGVTARQEPALKPGTARRDFGSRAFVGGVSDGGAAMAVFDFERDGLEVRKAWFFSDGGLVALGAGLNDVSESDVVTTLNQARARGPMEKGEHWLWHDGLLYAALDGKRLEASRETRRSSWRVIHAQASEAPVEGEVLTVWREHGRRPTGDSYAYLVAPVDEAEAAVGRVEDPGVRVLANTPQVQAVAHGASGVLGVVFYEAGEWNAGILGRLAVDAPCAVLVRVLDGSKLQVSVADPTGRLERLTVRLGGMRVEFELPTGGQDGGRTVTRLVRR